MSKDDTRPENKPLDEREKQFVHYYLILMSAEKAALKAGYSETTARSNAHLWASSSKHPRLFKANVHAAIKKALKRRAKRMEVTADNVLKELGKLAFVEKRDLFTSDGTLKPIAEIPDHVLDAITSIEVVDRPGGVLKKIKLAEKKGALELLARHLGMLNDKLGIGGIGPGGAITEIPITFVSPPKREED